MMPTRLLLRMSLFSFLQLLAGGGIFAILFLFLSVFQSDPERVEYLHYLSAISVLILGGAGLLQAIYIFAWVRYKEWADSKNNVL